jgi:nucleoside-diphosphate-sugar epimerase
MKKILITGSNSYVGTSLEKWLGNNPDKYSVDVISLRDDLWEEKDFSEYDVVFHVAGIAHIKETKANADLYYRVNRDLAFETAKKAKSDGVKQFIFLSSMSVYGIESGVIDKNSPLNPKSSYGKSKLQAEGLIKHLEDDGFKIAILRPPMIYGKDCKGNYPRLASVALKVPIFPDIQNMRSIIYIDNLCELVRLLIDDLSSGVFTPQNIEYVRSSEMVKMIAEAHGKKIKMTKLFNPLIRLLKIDVVNKVFGDLVYEKSVSKYTKNYNKYELKTSIYLTERGRTL